MKAINYTIKITPLNTLNVSYILEIECADLNWSMDQYQRNRDPFTWEVIKD